MKHLVAALFVVLFVVVGLVFIAAALWPVTRGQNASITLAVIGAGGFVLAAGIAIPTDLGIALQKATPLLNRVPMPAAARNTIAQRISTSVQAIPEDKQP